MTKPLRIFYSWQSDLPKSSNLNAIRKGIDKACKRIAKENPSLRPVRDEATRDTSGSPNIALKILEKIEAADVFVADVTTVVDAGGKRACPNPNVGYELGYAVATLGWDRVILLFNEACGEFPNDLPFDFIQNRASPYRLEETDTKDKRAELADFLTEAIGAVVAKNPKRPAELKGLSLEKIQHDHDVENISRLMRTIHLPTLDQLIDELPHMIVDRSLWFYEHFRGVFLNSLFSLYDKTLESSVIRFYEGWAAAISHSGQYHDTPSGHAHVFWNPLDMPLPADREAAWQEIDQARRKMRTALDEMLDRLRVAYVEVKIRKTNAKAWKDYVRFREEMDDLERNRGNSRKGKRPTPNKGIKTAKSAKANPKTLKPHKKRPRQ